MEMEIRLLGGFSARRSGEEIASGAFGGRLARRLLRILLTRRGGFLSRDFLTEALWPRTPPADPVMNLNVLVKRARRGLGDPGLVLTGPKEVFAEAGTAADHLPELGLRSNELQEYKVHDLWDVYARIEHIHGDGDMR